MSAPGLERIGAGAFHVRLAHGSVSHLRICRDEAISMEEHPQQSLVAKANSANPECFATRTAAASGAFDSRSV